MVMAREEINSVLNDLIDTCRDSEAGFRHAAQHVKDSLRSALFDTCSRQAARFAAELEAELRRLGGDPEDISLYDRLASPGWLTVTRKLGGEDETAILAECECGLGGAEQSYAAALGRGLPDEVRSLVQRQYAELKKVCERIHALADRQRFGAQRSPQERQVAVRGAREWAERPPAAGDEGAGGIRREPDAPSP